jgi:hypothetical protein
MDVQPMTLVHLKDPDGHRAHDPQHSGFQSVRWYHWLSLRLIAQWQGHSDGGKLIMTTYTEVFGSNAESYERAQLAKAAAAEEAMNRDQALTKAA